MNDLTWKKFHPLTDQNAFICLVDAMGNDSSIVQAARVSYGKDERDKDQNHPLIKAIKRFFPDTKEIDYVLENFEEKSIKFGWGSSFRIVKGDDLQYELIYGEAVRLKVEQKTKDRNLIRYLMNHSHTTPFEMVEFKFMVQVPMDCWRQWIRHRTASVNEYSTRYSEAIDAFQITEPTEWRLQATDNKQGSSGYLPASYLGDTGNVVKDLLSDGQSLTQFEKGFHDHAKALYRTRLKCGVAKEQARKDLPLSTYTRAYWKCDLHNIFNFLRLRMNSHAQLEIRSFANSMFEIVKQVCPVTCEAFEDYVLNAKKFSRMEMEHIKTLYSFYKDQLDGTDKALNKSDSLTDREWKEFLGKL